MDNLEMVTESNTKFNKDAEDLCQRLNGQLMTPKQDDDAIMDKTLFDYTMARASLHILFIVLTVLFTRLNKCSE